ncbi:MAG: AI-2E family transporter [Cyanobacteria bacterium P01_H01_bin.74]
MTPSERPFQAKKQLAKPKPGQDKASEDPLCTGFSKLNIGLICLCVLMLTGISLMVFFTDAISMLAGAIMLTYLLKDPVLKLTQGFQKIPFFSPGLSKTFSIVCVYLLIVLVAGVLFYAGVPKLTQQLKGLAQELPNQFHHIDSVPQKEMQDTETNLLNGHLSIPLRHSVPSRFTRADSNSIAVYPTQTGINLDFQIEKYIASLSQYYQKYLTTLTNILLQLGVSTINSLIYLLTCFVLVFYLLSGGPALRKNMLDLFPSSYYSLACTFTQKLHEHFRQTIRGQVLMGSIAGILMYAVLTILGIKYQLLLSLIFGFCSIIPVVGMSFGILPVVLFIVIDANYSGLIVATAVLIFFFILKTYWLIPQMIHQTYQIHPSVLILTFILCYSLVGLASILLFFPLASLIHVLMLTWQNSIQTELSEQN